MTEELKTIDTVDTSPFKKLVMTIGELPTSFVDSMTYYELLAWLCNYLQNTVIPAVNNNAEAVKELQDLFIELKTFVDDYFDNLDVQEEINNKLDQMAEDGQLTQLIAQFLSLNAVMSFTSVAAMKLAENLVNGSTVETYGFYNVNDGGGAKYLVRTITNDDTIDEKTIIKLYDDYLIAELIKEDTMNVKQFGAKGDGTTDDTTSIQKALNYVNDVFVPKGTFMVNAVTHIELNDNNTLKLDNEAIIKAITNGETHYSVLNIDNSDNVKISGGTIQGERDTHTGETGEWGNCISIINGSTNIVIENIKLINGWGDGLYINNATDVKTHNLIIDNCRRNGISVISATNYLSDNDSISNINGTDPQFGVDVEPNSATDVLKNIVFRNLHTTSCTKGGFVAALDNLNATSNPVNIKLINYLDTSSPIGIQLKKSSTLLGEFDIINSTLIENQNNGIQFRNWQYNEKFFTRINGLNIYRTSIETNSTANSAIYLLGTTKGGNIVLENINVEQTGVGNSAYDIYLNAQNEKVSLINPIHRTNNYHLGQNTTNFHLIDSNEVCKIVTSTAAGTIGDYETRSMSIRNGNSPTDTTVTIAAKTPTGYTCMFSNINQGTGLYQIQLPADTYCRQFSSSAAPLIKLATGASLTLQRLSDTDFIVLSASGTITV